MSCTYETTCPYEHVSNHQTLNLAFLTERFDCVWNRIMWFCVFCFTEGLLQDCRLPPKKLIGTNNQEFTESKREQFETYLQVTKSDIIVKCIAATSHQTCIDLTVLAWSICNLLGLDYHVIMIKFVRQNIKFCVIMIIKDERKCQLQAEYFVVPYRFLWNDFLGPYKFCITILSYDFLSAHLFAGILPGLL